MSCNICNGIAAYKVLSICSNNERYSYYCGECFMRVFSENCRYCNEKCKNCIVINEFSWQNAFELNYSLKTVFHNFIEDEIKPLNNQNSDMNSEITDSYQEITESSYEDEKNYIEKMLEVYLYFTKNKSKNYISTENNDWIVTRDKIQKFQIIMKVDKITQRVIDTNVKIRYKNRYLTRSQNELFLSSQYNNDFSFTLYGFLDDKGKIIKYKNCFIYYDRNELFISSQGEKKICWIEA